MISKINTYSLIDPRVPPGTYEAYFMLFLELVRR